MADVDQKKRYILFSKEDGRPDSEKPCAFFVSAAGCRNGSACKFSHSTNQNEVKSTRSAPVVPVCEEVRQPLKEKKEKKEKKQTEQPNTLSSNDSMVQQLQRQLLEQQKLLDQHLKAKQSAPVQIAKPTPTKAENKRKHDSNNDFSNKAVKVNGVQLHASNASSNNAFGSETVYAGFYQNYVDTPASSTINHSNNSQTDDEDDNDLLFGAVNHVLNTGRLSDGQPQQINSNNKKSNISPDKKRLSTSAPTVVNTVGSNGMLFVSNDDAVKALRTSNSAHAMYGGSAKKQIFASAPTSKTSSHTEPATVIQQQQLPVHQQQTTGGRPAPPVFNPAVVPFHQLPWMRLVIATQSHNRFASSYSFTEIEDASWVKARPAGAWCANKNMPAVIAIDCEMCETTDPVTGVKCDNALIRFSAVDATGMLIDSYVSPGLPISDARTNIHGITEKQLQSTNWSLRHAQASLLNICTDNTIIIGHSLHKDLKALKFSHSNVIDTAFLFTVENEPNAAPSLRDVSEQILGVKLPDTPHDSVQDARAAFHAAAVLLFSGPQLPIVRKSGAVMRQPDGNTAEHGATLLIHRIPDYCTEQHIQDMLLAYTQIMPAKVNPITRNSSDNSNNGATVPSGRTTALFGSTQHRDLAFETISGPNRPDKQNRDQKRVYFKAGGYICVRK